MAETKLSKAESDALLKEARESFTADLAHWQHIRDEFDENIKAVSGDPWDSTDRDAREAAGRPCLVFDELNQYVNQIVNEVRANPRAIKFNPTGNGANDKTARFYQDKTREIEYRSNAQIAYTTAFENAVQGGFGWVRVNMARLNDKSFDKELVIEPVPNAKMVLADSNSTRPDSSDMKRLFCFESLRREDYKRDYPWAEIVDFSDDIMQQSGGWISEKNVRVAEFWKIKHSPKTLALWQLQDGSTVAKFEDEGAVKGGTVKLRREVDWPTVCQYLVNGVEVLKVTPWKGKAIPFVSCFGKVLWLADGARRILSAVTLARDPYMAFCWARSMEFETIGTISRNPYWAYEGSLDPGQVTEIQKSMHEPVAVLFAKPQIEQATGQLIPLPQRNPLTMDLSSYTISGENARRGVQSAMGLGFLPTEAQRRNEKSGVALKQIEENGQKGSYHFIDHYNDMIRRVGELVEDLMDKAIDATRDVTVLAEDGTAKTVKAMVLEAGGQPAELDEDEYSVTGDHAVTVSVGPEMESERQQANDFADSIVSSPQTLQVLGPEKSQKVLSKVVKLKNLGAIGDQIADIISPPEDEGDEQNPAVAAAKAETQQVMQMAQEAIAERDKVIEAKQIEAANDYKKAELNGMIEVEKAKLAEATKLRIAEMQLTGKIEDRDKQVDGAITIQSMKDAIDKLKLQVQAIESERDRQLEAAKIQHQARHDREMAERGHEQGLEAGEVTHQHAIEQQDRAAESEGAEA